MASAYDDGELSPEEKRLVDAADRDPNLPPPDSQEGEPFNEAAVTGEPPAAPAAAPAADPAADPAAPPAEGEQPAAGANDDAAVAAFLKKHEGKSAEEIARIAVQQQSRANREGAANRIATQQLSQLQNRVRAAMERRQQTEQNVASRKAGFREKLNSDPDGATAELHDAIAEREIAEADAEVDEAQLQEAVGFAQTFMPDLTERWPNMRELGREVGYSDAEISGIRDGRDIVVLGLAEMAGRLMKAGVIDGRGNLLMQPQPTVQPTDPRLTGKEPIPTLGGGGSRSGDNTPSQSQALTNLLNLSDADFDKLSEDEINKILSNG